MSRYPELNRKIRAALAPRSLGAWPTPLESAPALAAALNARALWIKREDRSSERYGGNKVRGLEFLLAGLPPDAVCVTVGGTGSTHCLATAIHARAGGGQAVVAQFPQPHTELSGAVARATARHAALVFVASSRATFPLALWRAWHRAGRLGPRRWIPAGGAHPRAVVGHVLAALELETQLDAPPDAVVLPLGTGGTAAGVALGLAALGWPTRVVAVRVAPHVVANRWRTARLARAARRVLARHDVALAAAPGVTVMHGLGRGYGFPTPAGDAAQRLARQHGLILDSTYGAKAFAALAHPAWLPGQRVVFWHTFSVP